MTYGIFTGLRPLIFAATAIGAVCSGVIVSGAGDVPPLIRVAGRGTEATVAFAPDGQTFTLGCFDIPVDGPPKPFPIELYRTSDGQLLRTLGGSQNWPASFAFSPDGRILATIGNKQRVGSLKLWDVAGGRLLRTFDFQTFVGAVAFAPDGRILAATFGNDIRLHRVEDGQLLHHLKGHQLGVHCLAFSPDGRTLASGGADNTLRIWRVEDGSESRVIRGDGGQADEIFSAVAFSPDGRAVVTASHHGIGDEAVTKLWGLDDGSLRWSRPGGAPIQFTRDGQSILATTGTRIVFRRPDDGRATTSRVLPSRPKLRLTLSAPAEHFAILEGPSIVVGRIGDLPEGDDSP